MGIYSHMTTEELRTLRTQYSQSLTERLTGPSKIAASGKTVAFNDRAVEYQQTIEHLKKEIERINSELKSRGVDDSLSGADNARGPIYLMGRY